VLSFLWRNVADFSQTIQIGSPIDIEFELFFDFILHMLKNCLSKWTRVFRDLRIKFDGVFVDSLDVILIKLKLVVIGEELDLLTAGFWISLRL